MYLYLEASWSTINIPSNRLVGGIRYRVRVYTIVEADMGYTDYDVKTNLPPFNGLCDIRPMSGEF